VPDVPIEDDVDDGREPPQYDILYKQAVGTQDTFLGMSGKDQSSTCCEEIVIRIDLPGTASMRELELDVKKTTLRLLSPK
jgi:dynein assembly factor 6, axonemal